MYSAPAVRHGSRKPTKFLARANSTALPLSYTPTPIKELGWWDSNPQLMDHDVLQPAVGVFLRIARFRKKGPNEVVPRGRHCCPRPPASAVRATGVVFHDRLPGCRSPRFTASHLRFACR